MTPAVTPVTCMVPAAMQASQTLLVGHLLLLLLLDVLQLVMAWLSMVCTVVVLGPGPLAVQCTAPPRQPAAVYWQMWCIEPCMWAVPCSSTSGVSSAVVVGSARGCRHRTRMGAAVS